MYPEERQHLIAQRARDVGRVEVVVLAEELAVTSETIRRDLTVLERKGLVRRVHGGAIPLERLSFEPALEARHSVLVAEKERIGKAALAELPQDGAVLLDAGSTTSRFADLLPADRELTVVTNALNIAVRLVNRSNLTVLLLGGRVRARTLAAVDVWALDLLRDTYVDVAFIGTNGISTERGLTTPDPTEAAIKRAMMAATRRVVVLADHTKAGNDNLVRFGELEEVDTLISDSAMDPVVVADFEAAGVRVVLA
jgi:DeoR family transcriptional regulator, fructose operon transcriptional repressor